MSHATVHVSGISSATSEKEVRDFFSFCGKIVSLSITPVSGDADAPKSATVTFEKEAAAKTALLLDQTQLGTSAVHVEAAHNIEDLAGAQDTRAGSETKDEEHHIAQEDKPRSRIVAEYLAHGYVVSDNAIMKAIQLDQKHGVSSRFTSALTNFDKKYNATERAKGIDENYQISNKAASGWRGLSSYFEKALEHPSGQKLRDFYVQTDKQVRDIHAEARRLADLKQGKSGEATPAATAEPVPAAPAAPAAPAQPEAAAAPSEKV
ncbi:Nucleotide-binding alpha-beta plait [Penicillium concentricum]|uniref:Nucleotide-binding alpha-beta plait n=1 Tax=Penicillium concentricum TaxID=293559 RepID=A0A9W9S7C7_9EURO|nr:Nucleotide-binding alpha-beta plait [Penicillium concentricum]KAJ5373205.1 Nucleotide-binding alpha-beta plait [Penicillium concentricum]